MRKERFNSSNNSNNTSQIVVNAGGNLKSTNSTYDWDNVTLNNGSVLSAGDITGSIFGVTTTNTTPSNTTLVVPATDVPLLANNKSFQDININSGTLSSGQNVAFNAIGTITTTNLRYVFPGNIGINQGPFTVGTGASLTVADGVTVLIRTSQTINVASGGTLSFGAATVIADESSNFTAESINVTGNLVATETTFTRFNSSNNSNNTSQIVVNAGGNLKSTNSTYDWDNVTLNNGSVLNAGDITGSIFGVTTTNTTPSNTTLVVPATDVPLLANNKSFQDININSGTLSSGQNVAFNAIGTITTTNLRYVFPGNIGINQGPFTVGTGASLTVADGVTVLIRTSQTINVASGGTLSFGAATVIADETLTNYVSESINVTGNLIANGTTFTRFNSSNSSNNTSQIVVNAGGNLTAKGNTTFGIDSVTFNLGSSASMSNVTFGAGNLLTLNGGGVYSFIGNDFSGFGANGVVAVGNSTTTIDLRNNYWGTTDPNQIEAKILHHFDDSTRPTVLYSPPLSALPATIVGVTFRDTNGNGSQEIASPACLA